VPQENCSAENAGENAVPKLNDSLGKHILIVIKK
jgi:hypothetical protein